MVCTKSYNSRRMMIVAVTWLIKKTMKTSGTGILRVTSSNLQAHKNIIIQYPLLLQQILLEGRKLFNLFG